MLQSALQASLRFSLQTLVKPFLTPRMPVSALRSLIRQAYRLSPPPKGVRFEPSIIDGVPYNIVTCGPDEGESAMLYLHGGAFTIGSPDTHRGLTGHLAKATGATLYVPDYRLAPEHVYPAALEDALTLYRHLLSQGYTPGRISIAGDSAGGGLTLALAVRLKQDKLPLPGALVMLSPWVDLTHGEVHTPDVEPVLQLGWIKAAAEDYRGDLPLDDPRISPVNADLSGLPPMLIQVGSQEILLNDARRLAARAREAGVDVTLQEFDRLWHVFQIHAGPLEAANRAIEQIARFLRTREREQ
ncbi:alpha/beta hydrolase [Marinobacter halodurans]|uniref:Alpha/beta hydrolase n=1 Tax=Marinobacter halodurans TaxID=2528979 RepID=A0ABY1ZMI4_9GAMM|nr:alpha/beta hydrolase [Marinobacter halodurans]TBW54322.1 alpha/beta hydrolase [Marinobacter halodurans]